MAEDQDPGTANITANPWAPPPVDWEKWGKQRVARLWQAAALFCNVPPDTLEHPFTPGTLLPNLIPIPDHVSELIHLAKSAIGTRILRVKIENNDALEYGEVDLTAFTSWACDIGKKPPPDFPWQATMDLSMRAWPWGSYETELLKKLALAADRFWKRYEPSDPSTAPTNEQVSDWLKAQGVATRTAEIMATILRADGLSTGPRK